ncbi:hypothetical protein Tco_0513981 [Tanacetum coccineum]
MQSLWLSQEIDTLKEILSNNVKENESLSQTLTIFKTKSKEKESKYIDKETVLEKQNKELENIICKMYQSTQAMHMLMKPQVFYNDTHKQALGYQNLFHLKKAQRIQPTLYDGSVIAKEHAVISMIDDEETLILEEENEITEVQTVFNQMEAAVDQCSSLENSDLNAQLQEKVFGITALKNELRKLKGKNVVNTVVSKPNAAITPGMFKPDIEPIYPSLKNNRDAHEELLVYVYQTCPSLPKSSGKLVVVTPINKDKRVRFAEPITSSNNIPKRTASLKTKDSKKPLLTSTGVKPTTNASGSKLSGNTKNNRISRPPCCPDRPLVFGLRMFKTYNREPLSAHELLVVAPRVVDIADSPVSTSIDQDELSTSIPLTQEQEHSLIISQGVEESPRTPQFHDYPLHEFLHKDSTSQGSSSNVRPTHTSFELIGKWTKDHPIADVIGDPSRSVSTRK